jgi:hypothetical protein
MRERKHPEGKIVEPSTIASNKRDCVKDKSEERIVQASGGNPPRKTRLCHSHWCVRQGASCNGGHGHDA